MMLAEDVFPSWWDDRHLLIVIDAGFDESGKPSKDLLVVSAIIGQTSKMRELAKRWGQDLRDNNVDFFHAKEHWNGRSKPYHRLSMTRRSVLLSRLIGYIHKYFNVGISAHLSGV